MNDSLWALLPMLRRFCFAIGKASSMDIGSPLIVLEGFQCFTDYRDARWVEHSVEELLGQRLFGICLGYEDLNDHDQLRSDPMLAVAVGKADPLGLNRLREEDRGKALAGKSTLNRLELAKSG